MPSRVIKGGVLGTHNATKKTPQQQADETKRARLAVLKSKRNALTPPEKQEVIDAMIAEWLLK